MINQDKLKSAFKSLGKQGESVTLTSEQADNIYTLLQELENKDKRLAEVQRTLIAVTWGS